MYINGIIFVIFFGSWGGGIVEMENSLPDVSIVWEYETWIFFKQRRNWFYPGCSEYVVSSDKHGVKIVFCDIE